MTIEPVEIAPDVAELGTPPVAGRKKGTFAGDVLMLVSGTTFAQALGVLASPILTRLFPPEAYGLAALFSSITLILQVIVCLRYEIAIVLPEADDEAANLLGVSLIAVLIVSSLTAPAVWLGRELLLRWLKAPELAAYLWLVPVSTLLSGVFLALNYWNTRTRRFGRLSLARVVNSSASTSLQLLAGFTGHTTGGTMIGRAVAGQAISVGVLGGQIWRDDRHLFRRSMRWREMLSSLKRYRKFPLYGTWAALMNQVSWQLPTFLLSTFFSPTIVGFYALGNRILRLPMSLVGQAIGQVFFQRAAEAKAQGSLAELVESAYERLVKLGIFPLLLLTVVGRDLFIVAFGAKWAEAGIYTQILSAWTFFWFISSPLSNLFSVLERQEFGLMINVVILVTRLASLLIGGWRSDVRLGLVLFSVSGALTYGYLSIATMMAAGVKLARILRILLKNAMLSVPALVMLYVSKALGAGAWVQVALAGACGAGYMAYVLHSDRQIRDLLTTMGLTRKLKGRACQPKDSSVAPEVTAR